MVLRDGKMAGGGTWEFEIEGPPKFDLTRESPDGNFNAPPLQTPATGELGALDGAMPAVGAMLSRASEAQIREFLGKDTILAEATKLPHFEEYFQEFVECLHDTGDEESPGPGKPN